MRDALGMQVVDSVEDLLQELGGLLLRQGLFLSQEVEELAPGHQLQDENDVSLVLEDVVQRDDVGVLDLPQDVHLALDLLPAHSAPARGQAALLDELARVLVPRAPLTALPNDGKLTAVDRSREMIKGL